jgi:protoheme IX farnesyltransferase
MTVLGQAQDIATAAPQKAIAPVRLQGWRQTLGAYVALTKPRIIELLLVTTLPAMAVAAQGMPDLWITIATLVGGSLAAGGANAINCFLDRDIDAVMRRTRRRPIPAGQIAPEKALAFGIALSVIAFLFLWAAVNLLTAGLAMSAILFYVFVYTLWLKRSTVENIVIGGAAGSVPPLCGWAAVTNSLDAAPLIMFAVIFLWTPPHFWALAIGYTSDYAQAGVPMLPVTRGAVEARRRSLVYAIATVAASLALYATGDVGGFYLMAAAALGGAFVWLSWRQLEIATTKAALTLFRYSLTYLALIFVAMMLDQFVRF